MNWMLPLLLSCATLLMASNCASPASNKTVSSVRIRLSPANKEKVARAIWKNECSGSIQGLTSWNAGEEFPSLGIGHFIWYPAGTRGIYEESFPAFIRHAQRIGANPPGWASGPCPWTSRQQFESELNGPRLTELRRWLASTISLQTDFIMIRSAAALPKMMQASSHPSRIKAKYAAVSSTPNGAYALIDYVNFKGEGTNPAERYKGEGWGLVQVLDAMPETATGQEAAAEFSRATKKVLSQRVANSPAPRGESRWLAGWHNRCDTYARPL